MRFSLFSFAKKEDGAVAVIAAISFTAMLIMAGVVIDLGRVYAAASALQSAADAAAYAAVARMPVPVADAAAVENIAKSYAIKNGVTESQVASISLSQVVAGRYTAVSVELVKPVEYLFGSLLGVSGRELMKTAVARVEAIEKTSEMVPLGISKARFLEVKGAQDVVIKYGAGDGVQGSYGALDLDGVKGGGANDYATWLREGYTGQISTNDLLITESGNISGPTDKALSDRYNACTHFPGEGGCTAAQFVSDCPRVTMLIVYEEQSDSSLLVVGFVPFILTSPSLYDGDEIRGSLIEMQVRSGLTTPLDETNIQYGLFQGRLIG